MRNKIFLCFLIFWGLCATGVSAASLSIVTPNEYETEITPGRDFYVIGNIKRDKSADDEPLNIKIELADEKGEIVRELVSTVAPDGLTPNASLLTELEGGLAQNDRLGVYITTYAPPEIVYSGSSSESVFDTENKIVVRNDYFAAIICGGSAQTSEYYKRGSETESISLLTSGNYRLTAYALNSDGEEVCSVQKEITLSGESPALIYNKSLAEGAEEYAGNSNDVLVSSLPGLWRPYLFTGAPKGFSYSVNEYYAENASVEYQNRSKVDVLLYALDTSDYEINQALGNAAASETVEFNYLYYDIGAPSVEYDAAGSRFTKKCTIVSAEGESFILPLRSETTYGDEVYVDFDISDGIVMTENAETKIHGVYSPVNLRAISNGGSFKIRDSVSSIKAVITDSKNVPLYETDCDINVKITDGDEETTCAYQFELAITPDEKLLYNELYITITAYDSSGNALFSGEPMICSVKSDEVFIDGYDDKYWGRSFCDTVNLFGTTASEPLSADDAILRGDFAAMINRIFGFAVRGDSVFTDIDEKSPYYGDVLTAYAAGFMTGDENLRANADDPITREEAIIILSRLCGAESTDEPKKFEDSDEVSFWAEDAVNSMTSTGIISGFNGYLHPKENITVAESAALILKTVIWMNSGDSDTADEVRIPQNDSENVSLEEENVDLSEVELSSLSIDLPVTSDTVTEIMTNELVVFDALNEYILQNCHAGLYVRRVGTGLDVRNYTTGDAVSLSEDAIRILSELTERTPELIVKYNPNGDSNIYYAYGKNENNKEFGAVYSKDGIAANRSLENIFGEWYIYTNK